jgi:hypothetical protein
MQFALWVGQKWQETPSQLQALRIEARNEKLQQLHHGILHGHIQEYMPIFTEHS